MAHLECESHNFHLLHIDYLQQYSIEKCFTSKKLSKKQFPIIIKKSNYLSFIPLI